MEAWSSITDSHKNCFISLLKISSQMTVQDEFLWAALFFLYSVLPSHLKHLFIYLRHVQTSSSAWGPSKQPEEVFICWGPVPARATSRARRVWGTTSSIMAAGTTGANSHLQRELQGCCGSILWPCGFWCSYGYMLVLWGRVGRWLVGGW